MLPIKVYDLPRSETKALKMLDSHPYTLETWGFDRIMLGTNVANISGTPGGTDRLSRLHRDLITPYITPEGLEAESLQAWTAMQGYSSEFGNIAGGIALGVCWLRKCMTCHVECQVGRLRVPVSNIPRRLLDITHYDPCWSDSKIRVVDTRNLNEPYCALSYRWPESTKSLDILSWRTRKDLYSGFGADRLHSIIRDACTLCHGLGFRYWWADALCIMQGDRGDWHIEAENVASIYVNATLTIAAVDNTRLQDASRHRPYLYNEDKLSSMMCKRDFNLENVYEALEKSGNFTCRPNGELTKWCSGSRTKLGFMLQV